MNWSKLHTRLVEFVISSFRNYIELLENKFDHEIFKLNEEYDKIDTRLDDGDAGMHGFLTSEQDYLIEQNIEKKEFILRFRASIILQIYSFTEVQFGRVCDHYLHKNPSAIELKKRNNESIIGLYKRQIEQFKPFTPQLTMAYDFINNIRIIRNYFIHSGALIDAIKPDYSSVLAFSSGNFSLKERVAGSSYEIELDNSKFLEDVVNQVEFFFKELNSLK